MIFYLFFKINLITMTSTSNDIKANSLEQEYVQKYRSNKLTFTQLVTKLILLESFYKKVCHITSTVKQFLNHNKIIDIPNLITIWDDDTIDFINITIPFSLCYYKRVMNLEKHYYKINPLSIPTGNNDVKIKFMSGSDNKYYAENPSQFYKNLKANEIEIIIIDMLIINNSDDIFTSKEQITLAKMYGIKLYYLKDIINLPEIEIPKLPLELTEEEYNKLNEENTK